MVNQESVQDSSVDKEPDPEIIDLAPGKYRINGRSLTLASLETLPSKTVILRVEKSVKRR